MSFYSLLENFPLQMCGLDDLQTIVEEAIAGCSTALRNPLAEGRWRELAGLVQDALRQVFLGGTAARQRAVEPVNAALRRLEERMAAGEISPEEWAEIQCGYLELLESLHGAFFRHLLRRLPTALVGGEGHFTLDRVRFVRYSRLHDKEQGKPTLERLLEFICQGGPQFEVEFVWEPLGKGLAERESPERRRRPEIGPAA